MTHRLDTPPGLAPTGTGRPLASSVEGTTSGFNLGLGEDSDLPLVSLTTGMTFEQVLQGVYDGTLGSVEVSEHQM